MHFFLGRTKVYISFWFLFLAALFSLYDRSLLLLPLLMAVFLHEGAHIAMLLLWRVRIRSFSLLPYGARLDCELSRLAAGKRAAVYLAAPILGLVIGGVGMRLSPASIFPVFNLCLGAFNLLPLPPLDGGNALLALRGPGAGGVLSRILLICGLGAVWGGGLFLLALQHNLSLCILALYLTLCALLPGGCGM